ncbi:MAG: threonylcarbamoyl-AMP synthase [Parcubacteria group bacterium]|nr:threonylcarbamoyl-AMP synthase [Parcubacteria group bacterium]
MNTLVFKITGDPKADRDILVQAAAMIKRGDVVAFPTETVYGLGANALDGNAVKKIYQAKGRPSWNPLIVHVSSRDMLDQLVTSYPADFELLAAKFMPGPLTFLLPKSGRVPAEVTSTPTVAVRMPNNQIALELIALAGVPIAAPSANRSGRTSPTSAEHVKDDLDGLISAIIDAGPCDVGVESTVLDLTGETPTILRPGGISKEAIEAVLKKRINVFKAAAEGTEEKGLPSPGMTERHYAPQAKLYNTGETMNDLIKQLDRQLQLGDKVGILLPSDWILPPKYSGNTNIVIYDYGQWADWPTMAKRVFHGLRWLDQQGVHVILGPLPPEKGLGLAVRDRLLRAAK